jgi:hypothetical protein
MCWHRLLNVLGFPCGLVQWYDRSNDTAYECRNSIQSSTHINSTDNFPLFKWLIAFWGYVLIAPTSLSCFFLFGQSAHDIDWLINWDYTLIYHCDYLQTSISSCDCPLNIGCSEECVALDNLVSANIDGHHIDWFWHLSINLHEIMHCFALVCSVNSQNQSICQMRIVTLFFMTAYLLWFCKSLFVATAEMLIVSRSADRVYHDWSLSFGQSPNRLIKCSWWPIATVIVWLKIEQSVWDRLCFYLWIDTWSKID